MRRGGRWRTRGAAVRFGLARMPRHFMNWAAFDVSRAAYYQRKAHFAPDDTLRSFSLAGPLASRAACDAWLEEIRTTLRMRSEPRGESDG